MAKEDNRDLLEFNASDARSKKALQNNLGDITGSQALNFGVPKNKNAAASKKQLRCIIMDEVDGMGAGDRSGMAELIQMIKKSKVPIICICNDRQSQKMKSLLPYCMDLRFKVRGFSIFYILCVCQTHHVCWISSLYLFRQSVLSNLSWPIEWSVLRKWKV